MAIDTSYSTTSFAPDSLSASTGKGNARSKKVPGQLTPEEQQKVEQLKRRDQEVRAHEQAHQASGGDLIRGGPNYQYETGPDKKSYAIAGDVQIDVSEVSGDSRATIQKAEQVRRAALAPADPSSQDQRVAAEAGNMAMKARQASTQQGGGKAPARNPGSQSRDSSPEAPSGLTPTQTSLYQRFAGSGALPGGSPRQGVGVDARA